MRPELSVHHESSALPRSQLHLIRELLVLAALLGGLFVVHGGLLQGDLPAGQRLPVEGYPLAVQVQRALAAGDATCHNPANFLGESLVTRPAAQVRYPPHRALLSAFPAPRAVGTGLFAHMALALLGAFLLARALGLGAAGAALVAAAFAYAGPLVGRLDAPHELAALAWLPLIAAPAVRGRGVLIAPLVALSLSAGAPDATAVAVLAAWVAADCPRDKTFAAGVALGVAGAAAAWWPWRVSLAPPGDPLSLLTLVAPFARGGALPVEPVGAGGPGAWCGAGAFGTSVMYVGLVPLLVLALVEPEGSPDRAARAGARLARTGLALALAGALGAPLPASLGAAVLALGLALGAASALAGPFRVRAPELLAWTALAAVALGLLAYARHRGLGAAPLVLAVRGSTLVGPEPLAQALRGGAAAVALALACTLVVLGVVARRADGRFSPAGAALVLALLVHLDQGLLFARRAFGAHPARLLAADAAQDRALLGHLGLDPARTILVLDAGQHPRRALFGTLSPAQGLSALMRGGRANLVNGWTVLGGPDADVPPELARAFTRWPPHPVADGAALRRAGVGVVLSDGSGFGRAVPAVGQVPLFGRPLFLHRLDGSGDATLCRVVAAGRDPVSLRAPGQPDRQVMALAAPGESVTRIAADGPLRVYAVRLVSPAVVVFPLAAGAWVASTGPLADAGGLAAVELPAGDHRVALTFRAPGSALEVTAGSAALWLFCCLLL